MTGTEEETKQSAESKFDDDYLVGQQVSEELDMAQVRPRVRRNDGIFNAIRNTVSNLFNQQQEQQEQQQYNFFNNDDDIKTSNIVPQVLDYQEQVDFNQLLKEENSPYLSEFPIIMCNLIGQGGFGKVYMAIYDGKCDFVHIQTIL